MADAARRISAGETFAEIKSDLHYGVLAEVEECGVDHRFGHLVNQPL
jgi:hypothetical protein